MTTSLLCMEWTQIIWTGRNHKYNAQVWWCSSPTKSEQRYRTIYQLYLKIPTSPLVYGGSIFARCGYQRDIGNLHYIHLILQVLFFILSTDQKNVNTLVTVLDVIILMKYTQSLMKVYTHLLMPGLTCIKTLVLFLVMFLIQYAYKQQKMESLFARNWTIQNNSVTILSIPIKNYQTNSIKDVLKSWLNMNLQNI